MLVSMAAFPIPIHNLCTQIRHFCSGDGDNNRRRLIQILAGMNQAECSKLREAYTEIYGDDLTSIHLGFMSLSHFILPPFERDAAVASHAISSPNLVNYEALIEIFTCRKSSHVLLILQTYWTKYKRQLDVDIASIEPSHPHQKILMALSASHKAHHADLSHHIAKCDARRLYQTGEGRGGGAIDEPVVLEIFSKRGIQQLKLTFLSYKHIYGHSYTSFLKSRRPPGDFEDAVRLVTECICNPPRHFAKVLHRSLIREGVDYGTLGRVMVSRAEVELDEIQRSFEKKYDMKLETAICESILEGDYRDFLLALTRKRPDRIANICIERIY